MTITRHDEHLQDRAAMLAMRATIAASAVPPLSPESRPGNDEMIAKTPAPDGVDWSSATVGGVPGWWCRPHEAAADSAILYLHGGAYVLGSATAYRGFASQVASRARVATFVADYALAPERPFPAAFDDATKALDGLRTEGFERIALVGDSAGGGLALALLLARPRDLLAAAVFSPWIDLTLSGDSMETRAGDDPLLSRASLTQARDLYLAGADPNDPRANALKGDFAPMPPVRIDVGEDEVLLDDSVRFHDLATAAGRSCDLNVWQGMVHVFPSNIAMLKASVEALDAAGGFLRSQFDGQRTD